MGVTRVNTTLEIWRTPCDRRWVDKLAVVTGTSAGIGRATALELAAAGMRVLAVARRRTALAESSGLSNCIEPIVADVATQEGSERIDRRVGQRQVYQIHHPRWLHGNPYRGAIPSANKSGES